MRPGNGVCPQMRAVAIIAVTPPNNDLYIRLTRASADSVVGQAQFARKRAPSYKHRMPRETLATSRVRFYLVGHCQFLSSAKNSVSEQFELGG
jgi:hypothetical protein